MKSYFAFDNNYYITHNELHVTERNVWGAQWRVSFNGLDERQRVFTTEIKVFCGAKGIASSVADIFTFPLKSS